MPGIIVIGRVLLQLAAQQHAAAYHNEISGQNDQYHRHKEQCQRHQRLLDGDCHVVSHSQQDKAQQAQKPIGARGLFAGGFALQQLDSRGSSHRDRRPQQKQQVNDPKNEQRGHNSRSADGKDIADATVHEVHQAQLRQLGKSNAAQQPCRRGADGHKNRFPYLDAHQVAAPHAQDVIKAEFLFAAAQQEGMGIKEKNAGEDGHHPAAQRQNGGSGRPAAHAVQHFIVLQKDDDIVHHRHTGTGKQIGDVQALVFPDTGQRQPGIQPEFHCSIPPVASRVRVPLISW